MIYGQSPEPTQYPGPPGGPERPRGSGPAVASLVLGLLGLVLPFLPMAMDGFRQYAGLPFAIGGLVFGVVACLGRRRGLPVAVLGLIVSTIAMGIALFMVVSYAL
ncbi:hypothetical protein L3Q67_39395 [Saccharothrix sp. AJ9571]|nr:hypothetical protein L3Q67_39395 [Saccharothrix sp. AJ9571]